MIDRPTAKIHYVEEFADKQECKTLMNAVGLRNKWMGWMGCTAEWAECTLNEGRISVDVEKNCRRSTKTYVLVHKIRTFQPMKLTYSTLTYERNMWSTNLIHIIFW